MCASEPRPSVEMIIDQRRVSVAAGDTVLEGALAHGIFIPHLCFHPALSSPAHCRLCLVEVEFGERRELSTACNAPALADMVVRTHSPAVLEARAGVLEFTLANHPPECAVCAGAGECELQDYAFVYGRGSRRFAEEKLARGCRDLGAGVLLWAERCIHCSRCIRFCDEISGGGELGYVRRGLETEPALFAGEPLQEGMAGNLVDLCPVGALVETPVPGAPPAWRLRGVDSLCPGCSAGCNVRLDVGGGRVWRLKPRVNLELNQYWICDQGRHGWHYVHSEERLRAPLRRQEGAALEVSWEEALEAAQELRRMARLGGGECIGVLCSGWATNEEAHLLLRLAQEGWQGAQVCLHPPVDPRGDRRFEGGFVRRAEKAPNARGLREAAAAAGVELVECGPFWEAIASGRLRALYVLGGSGREWLSAAELEVLERLEVLVVQDILHSELTRRAGVVLPGAAFVEKEGTYTSAGGHVQRLRRALAPCGRALPDWRILCRLSRAADLECPWKDPGEILAAMGGFFAGLTYEALEEGAPGRAGGQAYGGGWASQLQRRGFIHVEDHSK